ncbi:MAG: TatD family hydrolase, partial [Pseudomonadota bacterium]
MPVLVDSHCHLDFPDFEPERDAIVTRARAAGIVRMVTISTKVHQFDRVRAIAEMYDDVFCSVGTHPHHADKEPDITTDDLLRHADHDRVVAIGEAGLDYFYDKSSREAQETGFRRHIDAARRSGLPLVIHSREADDDMAAILTEETEGKGPFPFVLHCFTGGEALARQGVELGGYVSFSGIAAFKKSTELRDIAQSLPRERILVETDAPYLAPPPHRGKRNEPSYVAHTAAVIADHFGEPPDDFASQTTENFYRLFSKVPR